MDIILLIPVWNVEPVILDGLSEALTRIFESTVRTGAEVSLPRDAYNPVRKQYHSGSILKLLKSFRPEGGERILGITEADLYVPKLNFIFGEADIASKTAVISVARLRQEFYGGIPDLALLIERAVKEAVHEIGHTKGLGHCRNQGCIMQFSNTIRDTDAKGPGFCEACSSRLGLAEYAINKGSKSGFEES